MRYNSIKERVTKPSLPSLVKLCAAHRVRKTGVAAEGIKEGMHFDVLQYHRLFLVGPLEPDKCLFVVAEPQISVHKSSSRNVACLLPSF